MDHPQVDNMQEGWPRWGAAMHPADVSPRPPTPLNAVTATTQQAQAQAQAQQHQLQAQQQMQQQAQVQQVQQQQAQQQQQQQVEVQAQLQQQQAHQRQRRHFSALQLPCLYCGDASHDILDCEALEEDKRQRVAQRRQAEAAVGAQQGVVCYRNRKSLATLIRECGDGGGGGQAVGGHEVVGEQHAVLTVRKSGYAREKSIPRDSLFNNGKGLDKETHAALRMRVLRGLMDAVICPTEEAGRGRRGVREQRSPPVLVTLVAEAMSLIAPELHRVVLDGIGVARLCPDGSQEILSATLGKVFMSLRKDTVGEEKGIMENVKRALVGGDPKRIYPCLTGVRAMRPVEGSADRTAVVRALSDPFVRYVSGEVTVEAQVGTILALVERAPEMKLSVNVKKRGLKRVALEEENMGDEVMQQQLLMTAANTLRAPPPPTAAGRVPF